MIPYYAVVLNRNGISLAQADKFGPSSNRLFWRPALLQSQIALDRAFNAPVGVLLNAFAEESVLLTKLNEIMSVLRAPLLVRLHPNSRVRKDRFPAGIDFHDIDESLEKFVDRVGVVVCGNTSAQLKALCLGAPIVQVPGLDPLSFDHHGYVRMGVVFGASDIKRISEESIRGFYSSDAYRDSASKLLGPTIDCRKPGLGDFCKVVGEIL